ncbi:TPA: hypothetical protein ACP32N_005029 [Pseudomonas aeruginosa]
MTTQLNLNTGFQLYHELGMTRELHVRADITEITWPRRGYRAVLLLSYKTCDRSPCLAAGYAVAAEFLFNGLSAMEYRRAISAAKLVHGGSSSAATGWAKMHAVQLLLNSGRAVCIQRDVQILKVIAEETAVQLLPAPELLPLISNCTMYDGQAVLASSQGPVTPDAVKAQVRNTLAEGCCNYSVESIREAHAMGEHIDWNRKRQPLAS